MSNQVYLGIAALIGMWLTLFAVVGISMSFRKRQEKAKIKAHKDAIKKAFEQLAVTGELAAAAYVAVKNTSDVVLDTGAKYTTKELVKETEEFQTDVSIFPNKPRRTKKGEKSTPSYTFDVTGDLLKAIQMPKHHSKT